MTLDPAPDPLLAVRDDPIALGQLAVEARQAAFGLEIVIHETPPQPERTRAAVLRRGEWIPCEDWPDAGAWQAGDRNCVRVEPEEAERWLEYMKRLAARELASPTESTCTIAPFTSQEAGLHSLWTIAVARLLLPATIRVEARHDRLGTHLAQVALAFGADTLSGPLASARALPLAGVTRPNETSIEALETLVRTAGLVPFRHEDATPRPIGDEPTRALLHSDETTR